jgi:predicted amidohydrolase YtcJ
VHRGPASAQMGFDLLENAVQSHQVSGAIERRIEHCAICPSDLQDRVCAQGIVPAMQPAFFWEFGDGYIYNYGRDRGDTMFPVKSLIAARVPVAGSSDALVTHYAPLFGIEQALTRRTMAGDVCGPDERVDLPTAIRLHTIHGAFASVEESFRGSLEVGKAADLVVLAEDLSRGQVEQFRHVGVAMTVAGGEVVYEA